jgi:hypothetical protein
MEKNLHAYIFHIKLLRPSPSICDFFSNSLPNLLIKVQANPKEHFIITSSQIAKQVESNEKLSDTW